jgi:hypothetical protein
MTRRQSTGWVVLAFAVWYAVTKPAAAIASHA